MYDGRCVPTCWGEIRPGVYRTFCPGKASTARWRSLWQNRANSWPPIRRMACCCRAALLSAATATAASQGTRAWLLLLHILSDIVQRRGRADGKGIGSLTCWPYRLVRESVSILHLTYRAGVDSALTKIDF